MRAAAAATGAGGAAHVQLRHLRPGRRCAS